MTLETLSDVRLGVHQGKTKSIGDMRNGDIMDFCRRLKTCFIYGVFICYILLLMKILFFSRVSLSELFSSHRTVNRSMNLIPFYSIMEYLSDGSALIKRFSFANVAGNIAIFIPLGVFLPFFRKDKRLKINLLFILAASLLVEIIQGLFGIGAADIDDVILNCLGGCVGIVGYKLLQLVLRDSKRISTVIAILSAMGLPVILYYLFMIRMRF